MSKSFCLCVIVLVWASGISVAQAQPKADEKGKTFDLDLGRGVKMKLIRVSAGKFTMGSQASEKGRIKEQEAQKEVTIPDDFFIAEAELTQAQWKAVMGTTPWKGQQYTKEGDNYPATYVSPDDAHAFLSKLAKSSGRLVRLPKEAEWEYACRAGTKTAYSFGDSDRNLGDYGWFKTNSTDANAPYDHEVKQKKPNPWGLYDMHGNVYEWCEDTAEGGRYRVCRSGAWHGEAQYSRSAARNYFGNDFRMYGQGFRVVMDIAK